MHAYLINQTPPNKVITIPIPTNYILILATLKKRCQTDSYRSTLLIKNGAEAPACAYDYNYIFTSIILMGEGSFVGAEGRGSPGSKVRDEPIMCLVRMNCVICPRCLAYLTRGLQQ